MYHQYMGNGEKAGLETQEMEVQWGGDSRGGLSIGGEGRIFLR